MNLYKILMPKCRADISARNSTVNFSIHILSIRFVSISIDINVDVPLDLSRTIYYCVYGYKADNSQRDHRCIYCYYALWIIILETKQKHKLNATAHFVFIVLLLDLYSNDRCDYRIWTEAGVVDMGLKENQNKWNDTHRMDELLCGLECVVQVFVNKLTRNKKNLT